MDKLKAMQYLCWIDETGSFSAAARLAKVPVSSLSRSIQALEAQLGAELLRRSTRHVALTEIGLTYLNECKSILTAINRAEGQVGSYQSRPAGVLRISALPLYAELRLLPILEKFQNTYPDIVLDLDLSNQIADFNRDAIDIAIRGGSAPDERVIAQQIDDNTHFLWASKKYLKRYGTPTHRDDLAQHRALLYRAPTRILQWLTQRDGEWQSVDIATALISNGGRVIQQALLAGQGMALLPRWCIEKEVKAEKIQQIQLDAPVSVIASNAPSGIYLLYQQPQYVIPKIKVAVDFFRSALTVVV